MLYVKNNPIPSDCGRRYRQAFEYMFFSQRGSRRRSIRSRNRPQIGRSEDQGIRITESGRGICRNEDIGREIKSERKVSNIFLTTSAHRRRRTRSHLEPSGEFPERLLKTKYELTNAGELVYDCFMGSGTTAKWRFIGTRWPGPRFPWNMSRSHRNDLSPI